MSVTRAQLEDVLARFTGEIDQVPPMYSAIKINGQKLYQLARKGQEIERPPRRVTIHELALLAPEDGDWRLRIRCSKGTYVRALCHDIGQALGCGGCMSSLRRTMAAGFSLEDAVTLDQVQAAEDPLSLLLPIDAYFAGRPVLILHPEAERKLRNGMTLVLSQEEIPENLQGECRVYSQSREFLALGSCDGRTLRTIKSFFTV